jgi:hypothetical protein
MSQIPALPQGVGGEAGKAMEVAVNDRLRRIGSELDTLTGAAGKQGATGAAGAAGSGSGSGAYYTIIPVGGVATVDLAHGLTQRILLVVGTPVSIPRTIWTGSAITAGMHFTLYVDEPPAGGADAPQFNTATTIPAGNFASDVPLVQIDPTGNTRTTYQFGSHPGIVWGLDATPRTGGAIS